MIDVLMCLCEPKQNRCNMRKEISPAKTSEAHVLGGIRDCLVTLVLIALEIENTPKNTEMTFCLRAKRGA